MLKQKNKQTKKKNKKNPQKKKPEDSPVTTPEYRVNVVQHLLSLFFFYFFEDGYERRRVLCFDYMRKKKITQTLHDDGY